MKTTFRFSLAFATKMAEVNHPKRKLPPKKNVLPPLSPSADNEKNPDQIRPVRKKKKKPIESSEEDGSAAAGVVDEKPSPRRRPRTATPSRAQEGSGEQTKDRAQPSPEKKKKTRTAKLKSADGDTTGDSPISDRSATGDQEDVGSKASLIKEETPRKKGRKKKGKKKAEGQSESPDLNDGFLVKELQDIPDDVIPIETRKEGGDGKQTKPYLTTSPVLQSQPIEKIFIETNRGFKGLTKTQLTKRIAQVQEKKAVQPEPPKDTTLEFGLRTHRVFQMVCLYLHGLTAGMALWQIVFAFVLLRFQNEDFLDHYRPMALPVQCVFYLLLALCVISACDRFDIGNLSGNFVVEALTLQNGAVSILIYLAALVLSLSAVDVEDRIHLRDVQPYLWNSTDDTQKEEMKYLELIAYVNHNLLTVSNSELNKFRGLNTARGIAAILGWVVISITSRTDRLSKNLREGDGEVLAGDVEMNSVSLA